MDPKRDLLTWRERGRLWVRLGIRGLLVAAVALLLAYVGVPLLYLLFPFALALLLAWLLNPLVRWLKVKLPLSRKAITLLVLILAFGLVGVVCYGLGWALFGQVRSLFQNWRPITENLAATIDAVSAWLRSLGDRLPETIAFNGEELLDTVAGWLKGLDFSTPVNNLAGRATDLVSAVPGFAVAAVVFIMASYFIVGDYPRLRYLVTDQMPEPLREFAAQVRAIFMEAFGGYLKSQLLLSLGVFGILTLGFLVIRQPYGLLLAAGLAVMDFIPIIGAGTVMVPWAVVDLITANYFEAIGLMVIWGVIVLFRRVAEPKILGNQTGLSPILSLVGIYAGMRLGGVLGMVLGPILILVFINLSKLGIFNSVLRDLKLAAKDVLAVLKGESHA